MQNEDFHSPYLSGSRLFRTLDRNGFVVMEMPPPEPGEPHDETTSARVAGASAFKAVSRTSRIEPRQGEAPVDASAYWTVPNPLFPPSARGVFVPHSAPAAVKVDLLDSWNLLAESATRSADFHGNLFSRMRLMRFASSVWVAPTFSVRAGSFIFAQPGRLGPRDKIGERVNNWFQNRTPVQFELRPGEALVVNNHRFACRLQATEAIAIQSWEIWMKEGFSSPAHQYMEPAHAFQERLEKVLSSHNPSCVPLFGCFHGNPEDLMRLGPTAMRPPEEILGAFKDVFLALEQS